MNTDIPYGLEPHIQMSEPNEVIEIYKGVFTLNSNDRSYIVNGAIKYQWRTRSNIIISGEHIDGIIDYSHMQNIHDVYIENKKVGQAFVMESNSNTDGKDTVRCKANRSIIFGDNDQGCDYFSFALFNMKHFFGECIRYSKNNLSRNRLTFLYGNYEILIENRRDYKSVTERFAFSTDEYYISHYCKISKIDGPLTYNEASKILNAFSWYISFIFGKRHNPIFAYGYINDEVTYKRFDSIQMPTTSYVHGIAPKFDFCGITNTWDKFISKWIECDDNKDVLQTAIHWYLEANMGSGALEGAYILAFAGIELMYNVLIKMRDTTAKSKKPTTKQKINKLNNFLMLNDEICVDDLVDMRDYLVHYGAENRSKYNQILDIEDRYQKLLYLLERSILAYINFEGRISNRLNQDENLVVTSAQKVKTASE